MAWESIDTAPKDRTKFLASTYYGEMCVMYFNGEGFVRATTCRRCDGFGLGGLTHWMSLPKPPPAAKQATTGGG